MIKPKIFTDHPIAYESHDHIEPFGTMRDNHKNGAYIRELIRRYPDFHYMDLGCSGGGFVYQCINSGAFAVGIDGSDYSQKNKRAEWATIPDYLFTADITKPFHFEDEVGNTITFDAISAFDVFEHIHKVDLPQMMENITRQLNPGGILIAGIADFPHEGYHVTLESQEWWEELFVSYGLEKDVGLVNFGRPAPYNLVYKKPL